MMSADVPDVPKPVSPLARRRPKNAPVPSGPRSHGWLYCRVCGNSWAFFGSTDQSTWPQHRCGRNVSAFHEFLLDDPNHTALRPLKPLKKRVR